MHRSAGCWVWCPLSSVSSLERRLAAGRQSPGDSYMEGPCVVPRPVAPVQHLQPLSFLMLGTCCRGGCRQGLGLHGSGAQAAACRGALWLPQASHLSPFSASMTPLLTRAQLCLSSGSPVLTVQPGCLQSDARLGQSCGEGVQLLPAPSPLFRLPSCTFLPAFLCFSCHFSPPLISGCLFPGRSRHLGLVVSEDTRTRLVEDGSQ